MFCVFPPGVADTPMSTSAESSSKSVSISTSLVSPPDFYCFDAVVACVWNSEETQYKSLTFLLFYLVCGIQKKHNTKVLPSSCFILCVEFRRNTIQKSYLPLVLSCVWNSEETQYKSLTFLLFYLVCGIQKKHNTKVLPSSCFILCVEFRRNTIQKSYLPLVLSCVWNSEETQYKSLTFLLFYLVCGIQKKHNTKVLPSSCFILFREHIYSPYKGSLVIFH